MYQVSAGDKIFGAFSLEVAFLAIQVDESTWEEGVQ